MNPENFNYRRVHLEVPSFRDIISPSESGKKWLDYVSTLDGIDADKKELLRRRIRAYFWNDAAKAPEERSEAARLIDLARFETAPSAHLKYLLDEKVCIPTFVFPRYDDYRRFAELTFDELDPETASGFCMPLFSGLVIPEYERTALSEGFHLAVTFRSDEQGPHAYATEVYDVLKHEEVHAADVLLSQRDRQRNGLLLAEMVALVGERANPKDERRGGVMYGYTLPEHLVTDPSDPALLHFIDQEAAVRELLQRGDVAEAKKLVAERVAKMLGVLSGKKISSSDFVRILMMCRDFQDLVDVLHKVIPQHYPPLAPTLPIQETRSKIGDTLKIKPLPVSRRKPGLPEA